MNYEDLGSGDHALGIGIKRNRGVTGAYLAQHTSLQALQPVISIAVASRLSLNCSIYVGPASRRIALAPSDAELLSGSVEIGR